MKRLFVSTLILTALASCQPITDGGGGASNTEFTSVSGLEDRTLPVEGGSFVIGLTATGDWTCDCPSGWVAIDPKSGGAGDFNVKVEVGENKGVTNRTTFINLSCGSDKRTLLLTQGHNEPKKEETVQDLYLDSHFSTLMHYSTGRLRTTSAVMQSFDLSKDGQTIYYTQLNSKFRVYLSWGPRNGKSTPSTYMTLNYTGHGSNFTIEEAADGTWLWMDNYSSKNASGDYWGAQIISRFPVKSGTTLNAWEAAENYYFGESNISVAVDFEGDMLTILGISSGRIRTYKLSDLKALPVEDITLAQITYGGEDKAPHKETTVTPVVKARDARKLTPLGDFSIQRGTYSDGTTVSWQGFDIHGGLIYQAQGNGHADGTPSPGWVQLRKVDGTVVVPLTIITALEDLSELKSAGITDTGYMEPEGVKVRGGVVYCGFASKNSADERRGTIFNYNPALVR